MYDAGIGMRGDGDGDELNGIINIIHGNRNSTTISNGSDGNIKWSWHK